MTLVLRNTRYWNGESESPGRADVTCSDGRVVSVDDSGRARPPIDDGLEFDLGGTFLLPGLIDAHVHLVWSGGGDPAARVESEGEQLTIIRAAENAAAQLNAGVTTVRDLGSYCDVAISIARAVEGGVIQGPTVIASGQTIVMTGGHDPFWGIPSDGVDAVTRAVRGQVYKGAGVIKTAATGGVYGRPEGESVHDPELNYDELSAIAIEAHRRGRRVAAHALGSDGIQNAVRAGIDTIEHGIFLTEEIVDLMVSKGTTLCPTLEVYRRIAGVDGNTESPVYASQKAAAVVEAHRESVLMAVGSGVPIIAGTDAGSVNMDHPTLVDELVALVNAGVPTRDALLAATSRAADALDQPSRGRISVGSAADLIMLDKNPFEDVAALRDVWGVLRGQCFLKGEDIAQARTPAA